MTVKPHAEQSRRVAVLANGNTAYEVTTWITDAGSLPTKCLFVLTIVDPSDPKDDVLARVATPRDIRRINESLYIRVVAEDLIVVSGDPFARVASLSDLTLLARDRTDAVRRTQTEYITSTLTLLYPDLVTADAAYKQLLARLSDTAAAWTTFITTFETHPTQGYDLPISPQSIEDERRAVYATAVASRKAYEAALATAETAYVNCDVGCATDRAIHALLISDVSRLERSRTRVQGITETATPGPPTTNVKDFVLRQGAYASDDDSYETLLIEKRASLSVYAARVQACQDGCGQLRVERDAARADLDRALTDERRALADVRDVCPTFVPTE